MRYATILLLALTCCVLPDLLAKPPAQKHHSKQTKKAPANKPTPRTPFKSVYTAPTQTHKQQTPTPSIATTRACPLEEIGEPPGLELPHYYLPTDLFATEDADYAPHKKETSWYDAWLNDAAFFRLYVQLQATQILASHVHAIIKQEKLVAQELPPLMNPLKIVKNHSNIPHRIIYPVIVMHNMMRQALIKRLPDSVDEHGKMHLYYVPCARAKSSAPTLETEKH